MTIDKFEEKVAKFALEQGWIKKESFNTISGEETLNYFTVKINTWYKQKRLHFLTLCENVNFTFELRRENFDILFNDALKAVKIMGTLIPRTRKKKENKEN